MATIIAGLAGCALSGLFVILGIWYQYYLDHKPLQKQSIFPEPSSYPVQSKNSDSRISTFGAQCVEFDFNKGNSSHDWVSIVYKFDKYGVISKNDTLYFEVVFEEGNFNQVDLEIKVPEKPKDKNCHRYRKIDQIVIIIPSDTDMKEPIPKTINFSDFDESEVHNIVQLCFVVKDDYNVDKNDRCYGKYRLQNMRITKK